MGTRDWLFINFNHFDGVYLNLILRDCQAQFTLEVKVYKINLQNNLGFSLCVALSVCHMVTIFDGRQKSKMGVSTDWYVAVEHQESSSIEVIFVNYQTSKLQCNYQSYIQVHTIRDTQGFSGITPIALSRDFSVETLTGVQLYYEKLSQMGVSLSQKIEFSDCCIIAT